MIYCGLLRRKYGAQVHVSFFEIYCGKLYDLLNNRKELVARADHNEKVVIGGLQEEHVNNADQIMDLIVRGGSSRSTGI